MVNRDRINELRAEIGDDDVAEVVAIFCEEMEDVLSTLDTAPPDSLPSHLHFLKGSAMNIGLEDFGNLCRAEESRLARDPHATADIASVKLAYQSGKVTLMAAMGS